MSTPFQNGSERGLHFSQRMISFSLPPKSRASFLVSRPRMYISQSIWTSVLEMESKQFDFSNAKVLMRDKFIESSIFLKTFCRGEFSWLAWTSRKLILVGLDVIT